MLGFPEPVIRYEDLPLLQRIELKGLIQSEGKTHLHLLQHNSEDIIELLMIVKCMWILSDFRTAVNAFIFKATT